MNDKQQLAAMGAELRLTEEQAKAMAERMPQTGTLQILDDEPLCTEIRINGVEACGADIGGLLDRCLPHTTEQKPLCMAKRIDELEAQVRMMGGLLRETLTYAEGPKWQSLIDDRKAHLFLFRVEDALSGSLPSRPDTEWTDDGASKPTLGDYRELQAKHDQLQSKYKEAMDALSSAVKTAEFEGHAHRPCHDSAKTLLAGQAPVLSPHQSLLDWAVTSWHEQVAHRPMENVYRRTLDSVWRQVIRFAGEDPQSIIGPSHDDLLHAVTPKPEPKP